MRVAAVAGALWLLNVASVWTGGPLFMRWFCVAAPAFFAGLAMVAIPGAPLEKEAEPLTGLSVTFEAKWQRVGMLPKLVWLGGFIVGVAVMFAMLAILLAPSAG